MTLRIQYISDIHLEFYKNIPDIPVYGEIIVLAGDIGYPTMNIFWDFLEKISKKFKHIILVAGNHEYYHTKTSIKKGRILTMELIDELIRSEIERRKLFNIHFLQCNSIVIDDIEFIGATLWTDIPPDKKSDILESMNDYSCIFIEDEITNEYNRASIEMLNEIHNKHWKFLFNASNETVDRKKIFITHHLPSYEMINEKYKGNSINCAFASDILHKVPIKPDIWICGHSHTVYDGVIEGVRCLLNPIGYPGENKNPNWKACIELYSL